MKALQLFVPILAGATRRERLLACLGALVGIGLTGAICGMFVRADPWLPLLIAPMGASAVLLFVVPTSPLAQPWPVIGGNTLSAMVGYAVGQSIENPVLATGVGVSLAIGVMSLTRTLHPPGGATALMAALGLPVVHDWGPLFPLVPVALNSCLLVLVGWLFHRLSGRQYPHVPAPPANVHGTRDPAPSRRSGFQPQDVDAALARLGETFDIDRRDIDELLQAVALEAAIRTHGDLRCADIMSRDVVAIRSDASRDAAIDLLLQHNLRTLPVTDDKGHLLGTVGLRELIRLHGNADSGQALAEAVTAAPEAPALGLLPALTDGARHAIMIVDEANRVLGVISQTDLLGALGRTG